MGGTIALGLCVCLVICICISVCCCCQKKKVRNRTAASTVRANTVQPATVAVVNQSTMSGGRQGAKPPDYTPTYSSTMQGGYTSYPNTYTVPAPYPTAGILPPSYPPTAAETLPPTYPTAGGTLPPSYPAVAGGALPPAYPTPGGTLPTGYPPQQPYPAQPPDMPPPYPQA